MNDLDAALEVLDRLSDRMLVDLTVYVAAASLALPGPTHYFPSFLKYPTFEDVTVGFPCLSWVWSIHEDAWQGKRLGISLTAADAQVAALREAYPGRVEGKTEPHRAGVDTAPTSPAGGVIVDLPAGVTICPQGTYAFTLHTSTPVAKGGWVYLDSVSGTVAPATNGDEIVGVVERTWTDADGNLKCDIRVNGSMELETPPAPSTARSRKRERRQHKAVPPDG